MTPIERNDTDAHSADLIAQNIETLKGLFPEAVSEGKIDMAVLKDLIGASRLPDEERDEKYGLNWFGKRKARQIALTPSTGTLRPCKEDSVDWDTTKNLMIEGDNLEVLKLLQKSYAGQVKLIYIDPPYNTGKDFVYPDNFQDNIKNYLELTGQIEGGAKMEANTESSGRFHTDWLNMMYPRLKLARNLLKDDGVILISIDEKETSNLRTACNEIFGEENFAGEIIWKNSSKNDQDYISVQHEYIFCYVKSKSENKGIWKEKKEGVEEIYKFFDEARSRLGDNWEQIHKEAREWFKSFPESSPIYDSKHYSWMDSKGVYFPDNISGPNVGQYVYDIEHPLTGKTVKAPSRGWFCPKETLLKTIAEDGVHFGQDETTVPCLKTYLKETEYKSLTSIIFKDGRAASKRLTALFDDENVFNNPKDEEVLQRLFTAIGVGDDDIVLDFFSGSGTTAHAVLNLSAAKNLRTRFFLVQLPEDLRAMEGRATGVAKKIINNAIALMQKIGLPATVASICEERIRRAGKKIREESPMFSGDLGFRVFKLDSSNILPWEPEWDNLEEIVKKSTDHVKAGRSESDILYELLLKLGLDLAVPIEEKTIAAKKIYAIGAGTLMVCLDKKIERKDADPLALGMVAWRKELAPVGETTCVFLDSGFADDVVKTNLSAILSQHGLTNVRSL